jgi:hypothetical protein
MPEVNDLPKFGTVHRLNDGYTRPDKNGLRIPDDETNRRIRAELEAKLRALYGYDAPEIPGMISNSAIMNQRNAMELAEPRAAMYRHQQYDERMRDRDRGMSR